MSETLYIRVRGNVQGPYTPDELRAMAGRGRFSRAHEVSADRNQWVRASARPDLFPAPNPSVTFEAAAPPEKPADSEIELEEILVEPETLPSSLAVKPSSTSSPAGEWFYTQGASQRGPVSFSQLQMLVNVGEVSASDYVWADGMPQWSTVADRADLFPNALRVSTSGSDGNESDKKVSGLAIASLVLGLLGGTFLPVLGSILAVVFGHAALKEIRGGTRKLRGGGMATAGLVMGYFVLVIAATAIIVILIVAIVTALRGTS